MGGIIFMKKYIFVLIAILLILTAPTPVSAISSAQTDNSMPAESSAYNDIQVTELPIVNGDIVELAILGVVLAIVSTAFGNGIKFKIVFEKLQVMFKFKPYKNSAEETKPKKKESGKNDEDKGNADGKNKDNIKLVALQYCTRLLRIIILCRFIIHLVSIVLAVLI